jgi:hypothetical protein
MAPQAGPVIATVGAGLLIVIEKLQLSLFPLASVATLLTVVTPFGKVEPDAGVEVKVTPGQLSVAPTVKVTTAEHFKGSVSIVMFAGHVMCGFSLSITVTAKKQLSALPEASVTTDFTVVIPFGNAEPEEGVETSVMLGQLSEALILKVTTAAH